jgi:hypothetical protein
VRESVPRFLQELARAQLIAPAGDGQGAPAGTEAVDGASPRVRTGRFTEPELIQHDEPLHDVVGHPFDPQMPLAE